MDQDQLHRWVSEISAKYFHISFNDKVSFNSRLRTTGGRYIPSQRKIELNPKYLHELGEEAMEGIIKHELCHYHLHIQGKGYQHRDPEFRELLKKTGSPRFCSPLPSNQKKQTIHSYRCKQCGQVYNRKRKIDVKRYRCGHCRGKLEKQ
ncbi:SprT family protein [Bacillaceae bacterium S4-13-58]